MTEAGISKAIHELTVELSLQPGGIVTSTTEELQQGGYHATVCQTDVHSGIDVSAREMSALEIPRMVHQALADFLDHVRENKAPIHPLSISLMEAIASLEVSIKTRDGNFESPVGQKGAKGRLAEWGVYAHAQRKKAKSGSALDAWYELLEHLYEAARIIINSRQLSLELAFQYLLMVGVLPSQITSATCTTSISMLADCWDEHKDDLSTRLNDLADVLAAQVDKHPDGALRCIVFVQKRISTHIVKYFIETHPDPALCGLSCGVLYASSSPATASLSINPTESRRVLSAFSTGEIAVLVSTCVAEEGMDVPAANCVVRFDPLQNPVSMVQGRGRARQAESSFVVMAESAKRKLSSLQDSEEHQKNVISRSSAMQEKTADIIAKMIQAQLSRVSGAAVLLTKYAAELVAGEMMAPTNSLGQLKAYASKVKGEVTERVVPRQIQGGPSFAAEVTLDQFHVGRAVGQGTGATKQKALHSASHDLLLRIIRNL